MRYRMPVLAAGALAAALAFGPSSSTSAESLPKLNDYFVMDSNPYSVTMLIDAPAEVEGSEATILFDGQPFQGMAIGGQPLHAGPNMVFVPNMGPGWYSAVGAFKPKASNFDDLPNEE